MTRIVTVPFRNEDERLWTFIEAEARTKSVNGKTIRDMLYAYKEMRDDLKNGFA